MAKVFCQAFRVGYRRKQSPKTPVKNISGNREKWFRCAITERPEKFIMEVVQCGKAIRGINAIAIGLLTIWQSTLPKIVLTFEKI